MPGLGLGIGFLRGRRPAFNRLTSLLDSLGGILWLPNQHNYTLTADTAVAPSGDPVGYIGSHRQGLPENWIKYTQLAGGVAGTPGTMPTGWIKDASKSNLTTEIVGAGNGYVIVRIYGTANAISVVNLFSNTASITYFVPALPQQLWSAGVDVEYVAGTWPTNKLRIALNEYSGSAYLANTTAFLNATGRAIATRTLNNVSCAYVYLSMAYVPAVGEVVDLTVKLSAPQIERGKPTAFTPTYGTEVTRGANFEPAWQDTTANKPLLGIDADGKSILTFDGSNDVYRTGIQTPAAGYAAGVWQTSSTGSLRDFFSASNTASVAGAVFRKNATEQTVLQRNDGSATTSATITSPAFGATKRIIDGHWSASGAAIRLDGANEATSEIARTATSSNYFRIGAAGSGGDNNANYWLGNMLAQVYVPGARPGTPVEAQIRRLLAELAAVSGVV